MSCQLTLCLLGIFLHLQGSRQGEGQRRLYRELMKDYNPLERPVWNDSVSLSVTFSISFLQILDVTWFDHYLRWNESEFPGIKNVRFRADQIWTPDILLYNSADDDFDSTYKPQVLVNSTGYCTFMPPGIFRSSCQVDVRWFPFDSQKCWLKFGSWTYDGWLLDLRMSPADLSQFIPNGEWDLLGVPGQRHEVFYECCQEPFPDVTFYVMIRRRTLYYALNLLVPCVLLSSMTLLVFLLPADSGEKISLGITVLLSLTVFMLLVAEIMPATSDSIPLIGQYFASTMIIVGMTVIATVVVLQYHHHNPTGGKIPKWTRILLLTWGAWCLRMRKPEALVSHRPSNQHHRNSVSEGNPGLSRVRFPGPEPSQGVIGRPELARLLQEVAYLTERERDREKEEEEKEEWRFAAAVMDRLCLVGFSIFNILSTISILMSAPSFGDALSKDFL